VNDQHAFAIATGGGVDLVLTKNIAWRFAQFDYLMTTHSGPRWARVDARTIFRAATGLVCASGFRIARRPRIIRGSGLLRGPSVGLCGFGRHCDSTRKRQRPGQRFADL